MLEYVILSLLLTSTSTLLFITYKGYSLYKRFNKMTDLIIDNLIATEKKVEVETSQGPRTSEMKDKLITCVLSGKSKTYLGKVYSEDQIRELNDEETIKLFNNYESKLSGQMVKSLGKSIVGAYSMAACAALGMDNQKALSKNLEEDPFLDAALQRFTCDLYYRFGSFLAPLSVGLITGRHYVENSKTPEYNGEPSSDNDEESKES